MTVHISDTNQTEKSKQQTTNLERIYMQNLWCKHVRLLHTDFHCMWSFFHITLTGFDPFPSEISTGIECNMQRLFSELHVT